MGDSKMCGSGCTNVFWWTKLLVAVLAVPSIGLVITKIVPIEAEIGQIMVFILACWASTYLGMRLMQNSKLSDK